MLFRSITRNEEDLEKISKAFDEVYSIQINALDFFLIFCKSVFNQILSFFPLQTHFLSSYFLERKFRNILNIVEKFNNEIQKKKKLL